MCSISIIIPTYNSANTLSNTLESILNQNFAKVEILIMDGLSKDNTVTIAKSYNDDRIKIHTEKDKGVYDAMNKGISKAKGEWLLFLGSDDTLNENALKKFNYITDRDNFDIVYGNVYRGNSKIIYDGQFSKEKILKHNICHQSIFFKKEVFNIIGNYNLKYFVHADYDHNLKWFFSKKVKYKFEDMIVSRYGQGGFSSISDDKYYNVIYWNYLKYNKHNLNIIEKIIGIIRELFYSLRFRRFIDFKNIIIESTHLFTK